MPLRFQAYKRRMMIFDYCWTADLYAYTSALCQGLDCEDKTWKIHTRGHTTDADIISLRLALSSLLTVEVC